jgi:hypothetical protein
MMKKPIKLSNNLFNALVVLIFLGAAEFTARLEDWITTDVPFLASPDRERDLVVRNDQVPHGRPHGRYRKWQLNAFGFRGPEITEVPQKPLASMNRKEKSSPHNCVTVCKAPVSMKSSTLP